MAMTTAQFWRSASDSHAEATIFASASVKHFLSFMCFPLVFAGLAISLP